MSLRTRFVLAFGFIVVLTVSALSTAHFLRWRRDFLDHLMRQGQILTETLARGATDAIVRYDLQALDEFVQALAGREGIRYVVITDRRGRVLAERPSGVHKASEAVPDADLSATLIRRTKDPLTGEEVSDILVPVQVDGRGWGAVRAGFSTRAIREGVQRNIALALGTVLVSGLIGVGVALFLSRVITHPIEQFIRSTERIASGDLSHRLDLEHPREFSRLATAMNDMAAALLSHKEELRLTTTQLVQRERLAALGELSARIAHEIKNPIGVIRSAAQIFHDPNETPEVKAEVARYIVEEADRLSATLSEFLGYARPGRPVPQGVELSQFFERILQFWESHRADRPLTIVRNWGENLPRAWVDPEALRQVALNLLLNAAEVMPDGGTLTIKCRAGNAECGVRNEAESVEVEFEDTGPGISSEDLPKIFDPFFTTKPAGTGLGLSIVHQLLERQGGGIRVESRIGKGTRITVTLPAERASHGAIPDPHR